MICGEIPFIPRSSAPALESAARARPRLFSLCVDVNTTSGRLSGIRREGLPTSAAPPAAPAPPPVRGRTAGRVRSIASELSWDTARHDGPVEAATRRKRTAGRTRRAATWGERRFLKAVFRHCIHEETKCRNINVTFLYLYCLCHDLSLFYSFLYDLCSSISIFYVLSVDSMTAFTRCVS